MTLGIHVFVKLWSLFPEELKTTKQKIKYTNVTKDLFVKKKDDVKLQTLQLQKVQKMSTMLQGKTFIFLLTLSTVKTKIKNDS